MQLLRECLDVFAWTPEEMPGIDSKVIFHNLGVDPAHRPVMQKWRRSVAHHAATVMEGVDRLLHAKAIR